MRKIGAAWESAVETYLQRAGLRLLRRNFTCRYGEIDLIMREGEIVAFVEVRYRKSDDRGDGLASVGASKRTKLLRTASIFLASQSALRDAPCRFDVVAARGTPSLPQFDWIRGAFEAS